MRVDPEGMEFSVLGETKKSADTSKIKNDAATHVIVDGKVLPIREGQHKEGESNHQPLSPSPSERNPHRESR